MCMLMLMSVQGDEEAGYTMSREVRFGSAPIEIERFIKEAKLRLI